MSVEVAAAVLLIAVPIAFNAAFFELGRAFDYPSILRKEPDEILRRFAAGGSGLVLRWEALLVSALAMLPLVALLAVVLAAPPALTALSVVIGAAAALVQALGLVRWPFAVPGSRAATSPPRVPTPRPPGVRSSSRSRPSTACSAWASASTWATCSPGCGPCWSRRRSCRPPCSRAGWVSSGCRSASPC